MKNCTTKSTAARPVEVTPLIDEKQLAAMLRCSIAFIRKDRGTVRRIPYLRIGNMIRYDLVRVREALSAFEEGGVK